MTLPIGLQLYSVREAAAADYQATVRKVAELGYVGVEPAGFPGTTLKDAVALFKELELEVPSAHCAIPVGDDKLNTLDMMAALGCKRIIAGRGPNDFDTADKIKATCELFNQGAEAAASAGLSFGIHNHWWEYIEIEGKLTYEYMEELLVPEVFYEIDTYWVTVAGQDAPETIRKLGERVQLLHIKDGPCVKDQPMTAVGKGKMDFPAVIAAATHAKYLIVELDSCATDMMEAVADSISYLSGAGLGSAKS